MPQPPTGRWPGRFCFSYKIGSHQNVVEREEDEDGCFQIRWGKQKIAQLLSIRNI